MRNCPSRPTPLKHLHALCQSASGDAGQFKRIDNEIIELIPGAAPVIRFKCVTAKETPVSPIPLQREFARRVSAVEKLKAARRASLAELDALFASLQHRAFRGEL